jgi:hypothetical protein
MRWVGHVARKGAMINSYTVLAWKTCHILEPHSVVIDRSIKGCELDFSGIQQGPVGGFFEHGNGFYGPIKGGVFLTS